MRLLVMPFELIGPLQQKKKKDQFLVHWGGGIVTTPSITLSLSNFRAKKTQLKLVWNKSFPQTEEEQEPLCPSKG